MPDDTKQRVIIVVEVPSIEEAALADLKTAIREQVKNIVDANLSVKSADIRPGVTQATRPNLPGMG